MAKVKLAQHLGFSVCPCCGDVAIELWRDGRMIAAAIPVDIDNTAKELAGAIMERNILISKMPKH